jgi:hypothetical protein
MYAVRNEYIKEAKILSSPRGSDFASQNKEDL